MIFFQQRRQIIIYFLLILFLSPLSCSYKPGYLKKSGRTGVSERWLVKEIDAEKLSPEEKAIWENFGPPQYIRFFRKLSPERERVYEWIYTDPFRLVTFIEGREVAYVVVDDDSSPFNEQQKKKLFWGGIATATAAGVGLLFYYLGGSK